MRDDRDVEGVGIGRAIVGEEGDQRPDALASGRRRFGITRVTDEDYRCVWRPCPALDEGESDETA